MTLPLAWMSEYSPKGFYACLMANPALAPLAALAGVVVGKLMDVLGDSKRERTAQRTWLRDERLRSYSEAKAAANEFSRLLSFRKDASSDDELGASLFSLYNACSTLEVLTKDPVRSAAHRLYRAGQLALARTVGIPEAAPIVPSSKNADDETTTWAQKNFGTALGDLDVADLIPPRWSTCCESPDAHDGQNGLHDETTTAYTGAGGPQTAGRGCSSRGGQGRGRGRACA